MSPTVTDLFCGAGDRREQVRQVRNAVTPPAAEWLLRAVVTALHGGAS